MQKVLFVIPKEMIYDNVYYNYVKIMQKMNYEVQIITDSFEDLEKNCKKYKVCISNKLLSLINFIAYKKIKKIIKQNDYKIIICYGQIYGILSRIANNSKAKIIYTVDEFSHNKLICKIEMKLAFKTENLILTNKKDYIYALKNLDVKNIKFINGIGVHPNFKIGKRQNKNYTFLSIGEFNKDEKQIMQLESMIWIVKKYPQTQLIMCGSGKLKEYYENIIEKYGLSENVKIVNNEPIEECDCFITTSKKSGFGTKTIKMKFLNKPILAEMTEKNKEILNEKNLFNNSEELLNKMIDNIKNNKIIQIYDDLEKYKLENILKEIKKIYIKK